MKKLLSLLLAVCMLIGCVPLAAYAADGEPVTEFVYDGDTVAFVQSDGVTTFGMLSATGGSYYYLNGDNVIIHINPSNTKKTYAGFYYGLIKDHDKDNPQPLDVTFNDNDGTIDIILAKDKCGKAYAVVPEKRSDNGTTKDQYYLAIPSADKLPVKYDGDKVDFVKNDGKTEFGMWRVQGGSTWELLEKTIKIHYIPNNKKTYAGFLYGPYTLADGTDKTLDVTTDKDGYMDFSLAKSKSNYTVCGFAWPVAPVKKEDKQGTREQYYLGIPEESKFTSPAAVTFAITFNNWDGKNLLSTAAYEGETPVYTGATPEKEADDTYTYTFKGWDPELTAATADATYTATFEQKDKSAAGGGAGTDTPADSSVDLKVTNNVKMFKVLDAKLETTNDSTNLVVTLSASGYHYLYKGTFEEAKKVGYKTSKWIEGKLNKDSKYVFSIPVDENETSIPIISISQTYVDNYLDGKNKIERAFFPRLLTLDTKKKTLTVDDYSETKTLKVSNKTDLDISRASLETVGGPNSNDYASTLTLSMKSDTYTKAYIGTAKKAASAKDTVAAGSGNTFALKVRWMATAGDLDSIESYIGDDETFAFYNADEKAWEEFTFNINDSKYTLTVTAAEEAEAVPAEEVPGEGVKTAFIDVKDSDWYDGYAEKAADNGLMAGYPAGTDADGNPVYEFRGSNKVTRAMFVTILNAIDTKLNGEKTAAASAGFDDVASGAWYEKAVDWAYANGITAGKGDSFGVNDNVSRQDMAVFMYGYAKSIGKVSGTPDTSVLDKYADASSIAPYAKEAVAWLVSSGLMTGRSETSIAPLTESTRAEISAFAVNCLEFLAK